MSFTSKQKNIIIIAVFAVLIGIFGIYSFLNRPGPVFDQNAGNSDSDLALIAEKPGYKLFSDPILEFSIQYPEEFTVEHTVARSILILPPQTGPSQGPTSFVYISSVPIKEKDNDQGEIYNYNADYYEEMTNSVVGEEIKLGSEAGQFEWFTYQNLGTKDVAGQTAQIFENEKPWEFPMGTRELRYIFQNEKNIYVVGGYCSNGGINKTQLEEIVSTFRMNSSAILE